MGCAVGKPDPSSGVTLAALNHAVMSGCSRCSSSLGIMAVCQWVRFCIVSAPLASMSFQDGDLILGRLSHRRCARLKHFHPPPKQPPLEDPLEDLDPLPDQGRSPGCSATCAGPPRAAGPSSAAPAPLP